MNWLKANRKRTGITQDELAMRLQLKGFDIARSTVGHWEQGRYQPPFENPNFSKALAEILQMSMSEMFDAAGFEMALSHTLEAERAAYLIDRLPPDKRELAVRILEQLAEV